MSKIGCETLFTVIITSFPPPKEHCRRQCVRQQCPPAGYHFRPSGPSLPACFSYLSASFSSLHLFRAFVGLFNLRSFHSVHSFLLFSLQKDMFPPPFPCILCVLPFFCALWTHRSPSLPSTIYLASCIIPS